MSGKSHDFTEPDDVANCDFHPDIIAKIIVFKAFFRFLRCFLLLILSWLSAMLNSIYMLVGDSMKTFAKIALAGGVALSSFSALAAFSSGMSLSQIDNEVRAGLSRGESLTALSTGAKGAGVGVGSLVLSMLSQNQEVCSVVTAAVSAGYDAKAVISAASATGNKATDLVACAIAGGADPTTITDATAAGGGDAGGGGIGGPGGNFGSNPTGTFGGGGGGSVSRS